jgi:hypothetical protein
MFEDLNKKVCFKQEGVMYKVRLINDLDTLAAVKGTGRDGKPFAYLPLVFRNEEKGLEFKYNQFDSYYEGDTKNIFRQLGMDENSELAPMEVMKLMQDNDIELMKYKGKIYFYDRVKYLEEHPEQSEQVTAEDFAD